ncbi:MAG: hypothetical protein AAF203_08285, partial [Pseudomonadota bacterium]
MISSGHPFSLFLTTILSLLLWAPVHAEDDAVCTEYVEDGAETGAKLTRAEGEDAALLAAIADAESEGLFI